MSRKGLKVLVESLTRSAKHFNKSEVECLVKLFDTMVAKASSDYAGAGFDRTVFRDILHSAFGMTDDVVMDRVFSIFDGDNNGYITVTEWVEGLAVLLRGTLEEKMKLGFFKSPEEGQKYNPDLMSPSPVFSYKTINSDHDHDGKLSFTDFEKSVRDENLLLEAFGPCFPDIKSRILFEQKILRETAKQ
ncbi:EF-hand calcium-binding domain-containing protein 1 [Turdus rufiventris]|nr:EF-hand calcium-binding domain-containing protein 1 [Turdus rufiventris]